MYATFRHVINMPCATVRSRRSVAGDANRRSRQQAATAALG